MNLSQHLISAGLAAAERLLGDSVSQMVNCRDIGKLVEFFHEKYIAGEINFIEGSCSDVIDLLQLSADFSRTELLQLAEASPENTVDAENIVRLYPHESRSLEQMLRSYYLNDGEEAPSGVLQRSILRSLFGRSERYCSVVSKMAWAYEQILSVGAIGAGDRRAIRKLAFSSDLHFYSELARLSREERDDRLGMLIAEISVQK